MASIERTAYPRFPRLLTLKDVQSSFTPRQDEVEWATKFARSVDGRLALLVQLGVLSRNRRKFRQPINVACPAPGRWGRPNSRVTSRHFDHGNASRTSRPDCSGLDEAD